MPRGIAIVIGVRAAPIFDRYKLPVLAYAEADACAMAEVARELGYEVSCFLGPNAERDVVEAAVCDAAAALTGQDDTLLLSFSGHGVRLPGGACQTDGHDEHWCLYDELVVDDRLRWYWQQLAPEARVYTVADCCHSGQMAEWIQRTALLHGFASKFHMPSILARTLAPPGAARLYEEIEREREKVRNQPSFNCKPPQASALLLASVARGTAKDGVFMRGFRAAWAQPHARTSFARLRHCIEMEVLRDLDQAPQLIPGGGPLAALKPFELGT